MNDTLIEEAVSVCIMNEHPHCLLIRMGGKATAESCSGTHHVIDSLVFGNVEVCGDLKYFLNFLCHL